MNILKKISLALAFIVNRLIKRKGKKEQTQKIDYDAQVEERWESNFASDNSPLDSRFPEEEGDGYKAFFCEDGKTYVLQLQRKRLYSWVINKFYRYKDFVIESRIKIKTPLIKNLSNTELNGTFAINNSKANDEVAGICAVGWIFRNIEKAFYSVLVSNLGFARLDLIINNTPKTLVPWIKIETITNPFTLTIICIGASITVVVNERWVARIEDESIDAAGKIAFAAQSYNGLRTVDFELERVAIDSRLLEIEKLDEATNNPKNITKKMHHRLCEGYYAIGNLTHATQEIKQMENTGLDFEDALLAGKIYFSARLIEKAESYFLKAIELNSLSTQKGNQSKDEADETIEPSRKDNAHIKAIICLLNLYYYSERYKEMGDILTSLDDKTLEGEWEICNVKAHYLHYMGEHKQASLFYQKAFSLNPAQPLFLLNAARECESSALKSENVNAPSDNLTSTSRKTFIDEAISLYTKASELFLKNGEYVDLASSLNALERLAKDSEEYLTLSGKFYYAIEKYDEAYKYLKTLIEQKSKDASVWHLYGIILDMKKRKGALKAFETAHSLAPESPLYCFSLAKCLHSQKKDCESYVAKTIELDENNAHAYELYACLMLDKDEKEKGEQAIEKAHLLLPSDINIFAGLLHIKSRLGKIEECYSFFGGKSSSTPTGFLDPAVEENKGAAYNLFANELHNAGLIDEAYEYYKTALKKEKHNADYLYNASVNALSLGHLNEANELAVKALDTSPTANIYFLIAKIAKEMGDYERSKVAFNEGKKIEDVQQ